MTFLREFGRVLGRTIRISEENECSPSALMSRSRHLVTHYLPLLHRHLPRLNDENGMIELAFTSKDNRTLGVHYPETKHIILYPMAIEDCKGIIARRMGLRETFEAEFVFVLAHEVRHAYQYASNMMRSAIIDGDVVSQWGENGVFVNATVDNMELIDYEKLPWERDADDFAKKFCQKVGLA